MAHMEGQESNRREDKVAENDDKNEENKEELDLLQREGEVKSVPPSASFKSEVQLAGEFGQLEGMSALLKTCSYSENFIFSPDAESIYCHTVEDQDYGVESSLQSLPPLPPKLEEYKTKYFQENRNNITMPRGRENTAQYISNHSNEFFQQTPENSFRKFDPRQTSSVFDRVTKIKPRDNIGLDFFCPQSD